LRDIVRVLYKSEKTLVYNREKNKNEYRVDFKDFMLNSGKLVYEKIEVLDKRGTKVYKNVALKLDNDSDASIKF
ncbi:hypothetical protein CGH52_24930, partial [Vibrio parahaemolyticus]